MRSLSLGQKIWGVMAVLILAYTGSAVFSTIKLRESKAAIDFITADLVKQDQLTSEMDIAQRGISLDTLEIIVRTEEAKTKEYSEKFDKDNERFQEAFAEYKKLTDEQGLALAEAYEKDFALYLAAAKKARDLGVNNKNDDAAAALFSADEYRASMRKSMNAMNKLTADQLAETTKTTEAASDQAILYQAILAISSIAIAISIAFMVIRSVTNSIQMVVQGLAASSQSVTSAAHQISAASQGLAQASTQQAAALVETASATEEMSQMVTKNSHNARSTAEMSSESSDKAVNGKAVVEKMIASMNEIERSNEDIMNEVSSANKSMLEVVKLIEEIGAKTTVINDIVFQTKLLSFNASVEAARAGENGKGFAVVAEEVGTLAQMSGNAAKEISDLLQKSVTRVNDLVRGTQSNVEKKISLGRTAVDAGNQVAAECGSVLDEIVSNVSATARMATEISSASEEQSKGVIEITKAMSELDQMNQQNSTTSQECASAASSLSKQADALKILVNDLVHAVKGDGAQLETHSTVAKPAMKATKAAPRSNVVAMKKPSAKPAAPAAAPAVVKKEQGLSLASGDSVPFHGDGFEDL